MNNPELSPVNEKLPLASAETGSMHLESLKPIDKTEQLHESSEAANIERGKIDQLFSAETGGSERKLAHMDSSSAGRPKHLTKVDRSKGFDKTMHHVRGELSAPEAGFSKVIHNPAVDKTSDTLASTIARPNAILAGSISAFIVVAAVYFIARTMGYGLSGFETIGAFILGWIIGLIFDYARLLFGGRRS